MSKHPTHWTNASTLLQRRCFSNDQNNENFIYLLSKHLCDNGHKVRQCESDADTQNTNCRRSSTNCMPWRSNHMCCYIFLEFRNGENLKLQKHWADCYLFVKKCTQIYSLYTCIG